MSWAVALLTVLLAGGLDDVRQVQVRIEGYLGATRNETRALEELDVRVGDSPMRKLALTDITVLSGGPPMGDDLLQQVEMIKPSFIFTGGDDLIREIASAQPNQLLKIVGYTQLGSQYVLVQTVEKSAPITGPTPTPNLREKLLGF
jgi:hypothetical protein